MFPAGKADPIHKERQKTDQSLQLEREKTDRSLKEEREKYERNSDFDISAVRAQADAHLRDVRSQDDSKSAIDQYGRMSAAEVRRRADANLIRERERADKAIQVERKRADAVLSQERKSREAAENNLLDTERKATDTDLAYERSQTDRGLEKAVTSLTDEQKAHDRTKTALTTRGELLAIVSHDLRNPIGAISSCASMLLDNGFSGSFDQNTRTWIGFIKRNADSAINLTNDLLDVESLAYGRLNLKIEQCDIGRLLRETAENFGSVAAAKFILLRSVPPVEPVYAPCDCERILQVLANLVGNALKFTPEKGFITIEVGKDDGEVRVSVEDTGPGIPEDKKTAVFERFSQLGNKNRKGLGLGLYISKNIIEEHQGRLWVESALGKGSRFIFTLPLAHP